MSSLPHFANNENKIDNSRDLIQNNEYKKILNTSSETHLIITGPKMFKLGGSPYSSIHGFWKKQIALTGEHNSLYASVCAN